MEIIRSIHLANLCDLRYNVEQVTRCIDLMDNQVASQNYITIHAFTFNCVQLLNFIDNYFIDSS